MLKVFCALLFCLQCRAQAWLQVPDFPSSKRDDGVGVAVNGKAYFGTGLQEDYSATRDFFVLDPLSATWSTIAAMPANSQRQYACAFSGPNCFYVFGGDANGALNDCFKYD